MRGGRNAEKAAFAGVWKEANYPVWIRTRNEGTKIPRTACGNSIPNAVCDDTAKTLAQTLARHPALAHILERWPHLPDHIRQAILALVDTVPSRKAA